MTPEFIGFPKIPRYSRECIISEKIDGSNSSILIEKDNEPIILGSGRIVPFLCGSRTRWIFPENDNHGFAKWAYEHSEDILKLGPGRHFGEWWGQGINRGYGLKEKRFSLFNVIRWNREMFERYRIRPWLEQKVKNNPCPEFKEPPPCCHVIPVLSYGEFTTELIQLALVALKEMGSSAVPGFKRPEGIVIYHVAGNTLFKKTIEKDQLPKGVSEES